MFSLTSYFFSISILSSMTLFISSNEIFSPYFPKNPKEPVVSLCHPGLIWVILQLVKSWIPNYLSRLEVASDTFHRVHLWIYHKRWSLYAEKHHDGGFQIGHTLHLCIYLAYVGLYVILHFFSMNHKNIQPCTIGPCSTSCFFKLLLVLQFFMSRLKLDIITRNKRFKIDLFCLRIYLIRVFHPMIQQLNHI